MKSLLDLLHDETFLLEKYNTHVENAEIWASQKITLNPNSSFEFIRNDYNHYDELEKQNRDAAEKLEKDISEVRKQILDYLSSMIEETQPKKKSLFARIFKK